MRRQKVRQRQSAEKSKTLILDTALQLMAKHGWALTSFQMIADKCNLSQSNVIYHFKSKELLLQALLDKISQNNFAMVAQTLKPEHDAFERLQIHFAQNLEWATRYPQEAQVIILIYSQATHDDEFAEIFKKILDRAQGRVYELIMSGIRENIFAPPLSPRVTAQVLHNLLVGAFINLCAGKKEGVEDYKKREWHTVIGTLAGLSPAYRSY